MDKTKSTPLERALLKLWNQTARDRLPFISAFLFGLAAHMFAFTNKLVNADEIESLFGKGATITSGRWGLEAVKPLFPDYSMPWLWGLVSLVLISVAVCLIIRLFDIKNPLIKVLLSGLITTFPSQTGTFCFMFTSSAYALSFLCAVLAAYIFCRGAKWRFPACAVLMTASLGIYQAYIALAASLFVVYMIKLLIDGESAKNTLTLALKALLMLIVSLALYAGITWAVLNFTGAEFNTYVTDNVNERGILGRVRMAYDFLVYYLSYREFALITSETSRWLHILLFALCAVALIVAAVKRARQGSMTAGALILGCALLLPLAVNCLYLAMAKDSIHTLVIYSFVAFYVLAAVLMERVLAGGEVTKRLARDLAYLALTVALVSNVYFANEVYLKLYLQYENAYSFYSIMLSRAESLPGFDAGTELAIIGYQDNKLTSFPEIDTGYITGVNAELVNIYSRESFLRRYLGTDIPLADEETVARLAATEDFAAMTEYPYYGSVKMIDGYAVVKLG